MIFAWLPAAIAAPEVNVLYEHVFMGTERLVSELSQGPLGAESFTRNDPVGRFDLGLTTELLWARDYDEHVVLSLGLRGLAATLETDEVPAFDALIVDVDTDLGYRAWLSRGAPEVAAYVVLGGGMATSVLRLSPWPTTIAPSVHAFYGIGLGNLAGRGVGRGEIRLSAAVRADAFHGRAQLAESALTWRYFPGSVQVSLLVGGGIRPAP